MPPASSPVDERPSLPASASVSSPRVHSARRERQRRRSREEDMDTSSIQQIEALQQQHSASSTASTPRRLSGHSLASGTAAFASASAAATSASVDSPPPPVPAVPASIDSPFAVHAFRPALSAGRQRVGRAHSISGHSALEGGSSTTTPSSRSHSPSPSHVRSHSRSRSQSRAGSAQVQHSPLHGATKTPSSRTMVFSHVARGGGGGGGQADPSSSEAVARLQAEVHALTQQLHEQARRHEQEKATAVEAALQQEREEESKRRQQLDHAWKQQLSSALHSQQSDLHREFEHRFLAYQSSQSESHQTLVTSSRFHEEHIKEMAMQLTLQEMQLAAQRMEISSLVQAVTEAREQAEQGSLASEREKQLEKEQARLNQRLQSALQSQSTTQQLMEMYLSRTRELEAEVERMEAAAVAREEEFAEELALATERGQKAYSLLKGRMEHLLQQSLTHRTKWEHTLRTKEERIAQQEERLQRLLVENHTLLQQLQGMGLLLEDSDTVKIKAEVGEGGTGTGGGGGTDAASNRRVIGHTRRTPPLSKNATPTTDASTSQPPSELRLPTLPPDHAAFLDMQDGEGAELDLDALFASTPMSHMEQEEESNSLTWNGAGGSNVDSHPTRSSSSSSSSVWQKEAPEEKVQEGPKSRTGSALPDRSAIPSVTTSAAGLSSPTAADSSTRAVSHARTPSQPLEPWETRPTSATPTPSIQLLADLTTTAGTIPTMHAQRPTPPAASAASTSAFPPSGVVPSIPFQPHLHAAPPPVPSLSGESVLGLSDGWRQYRAYNQPATSSRSQAPTSSRPPRRPQRAQQQQGQEEGQRERLRAMQQMQARYGEQTIEMRPAQPIEGGEQSSASAAQGYFMPSRPFPSDSASSALPPPPQPQPHHSQNSISGSNSHTSSGSSVPGSGGGGRRPMLHLLSPQLVLPPPVPTPEELHTKLQSSQPASARRAGEENGNMASSGAATARRHSPPRAITLRPHKQQADGPLPHTTRTLSIEGSASPAAAASSSRSSDGLTPLARSIIAHALDATRSYRAPSPPHPPPPPATSIPTAEPVDSPPLAVPTVTTSFSVSEVAGSQSARVKDLRGKRFKPTAAAARANHTQYEPPLPRSNLAGL